MKGKSKIVWLAVCCLMVVVLVLGCAPQPTPPTPTPSPAPTPAPTPIPTPSPVTGETVTVTLKKLDGTTIQKTVEKPKYGGIVKMGLPVMFGSVDPVITMPGMNPWNGLMFDTHQMGNWARGAEGTGESDFAPRGLYYTLDTVVPMLAESWELGTDGLTLIWHIRKGVHFQNPGNEAGRLVGGRELNANDVGTSLIRTWSTPTSYMYTNTPFDKFVDSVTIPDKWTVVIKMKNPGTLARAFFMSTDFNYVYAPEIIQKYGNISDWHNAIGTGPFILTDLVYGSGATFQKNPNYWDSDPLHPENKLPYIDTFQEVLIPDISTQLAAMRTAKVDVIRMLYWDDAKTLINTSPQLKYTPYHYGYVTGIWMRNDTKPFSDVRVRNALDMAVDKVNLTNVFYSGKADLLSWPLAPIPDYNGLRYELKDLPESARQLYEYNPDKAKQLLSDAGFPNGMTMEVVCQNPDVDLLSVVKANWAKIGVDLKLDVKDPGVWSGMSFAHTYKQSIYTGTSQPIAPLRFPVLSPSNNNNFAIIDDPKINDLIKKCDSAWPNEKAAMKLYADMSPYIISQSYLVQLPEPWQYAFWQPWVKAYHGEWSVGSVHPQSWSRYVWVDEGLKQSMTGEK